MHDRVLILALAPHPVISFLRLRVQLCPFARILDRLGLIVLCNLRQSLIPTFRQYRGHAV